MTDHFGNGYEWKSAEQEIAVKKVVAGISPLFICTPIESGKTFAFLIPAKMQESKCTVVITALRALADNLLEICYDAGLDATIFTSQTQRRSKVMDMPTPEVVRQEFIEPNFQFNVSVHYDLPGTVRTRLLEIKNQLLEGEKCLVFCRTKTGCETYAREWNGKIYHATDKSRKQDPLDWKSGFMFATGSLAAGVDVKGIPYVLHIERLYSFVDYIRESGRGERSGEMVREWLMLSEETYLDMTYKSPETLTLDERVLREYVDEESCRNEIMTGYLNGEDLAKDCETIGGHRCDTCSQRDHIRARTKRQADEMEIEQSSDEEDRAQRHQRKRLLSRASQRTDAVKETAQIWVEILL